LNGNLRHLTRCAAGLADKPQPYEPERTRHSSVVKICGRLYVPRSWHARHRTSAKLALRRPTDVKRQLVGVWAK